MFISRLLPSFLIGAFFVFSIVHWTQRQPYWLLLDIALIGLNTGILLR